MISRSNIILMFFIAFNKSILTFLSFNFTSNKIDYLFNSFRLFNKTFFFYEVGQHFNLLDLFFSKFLVDEEIFQFK